MKEKEAKMHIINKQISIGPVILFASFLLFIIFDNITLRTHVIEFFFSILFLLILALIAKYTNNRFFYAYIYENSLIIVLALYFFFRPAAREEFITYLINIF